ncbi:Acyl-CoA-binding protein, ACBP domain and Ankyrin repeat and FERM/acyl-CoA-binding protein, 3-helical bundle domain and Ankyrin repeat-containing domain-containing protein [Strongyloides ratti]|uniref:Acyl-CoA-binding domain-containing protein 6 n=1 Tax=Strongyloides ratti TaxID=34506 RepID=A0A090LLA5_STRRB|nr:Acyl-CoA-binding protein, ACBP domain and Ankyrin repeat and FERM/acyl-CoA-binding protein, 3-helical bundle domain and Ankyrin repeat-containing domain-containing protein [Strongyloides ratti]CEF68315.1 Acyl-CoA-binding protein, ACBP domain and Ankyrin repeat and FERM/acyl-CoA-binding protein, 3-helical bundle domain and Ankyrin repeat-containing domain-containing protein [Strongyloides ratti]
MLALHMVAFYDWSYGLSLEDLEKNDETVDVILMKKFEKACQIVPSIVNKLSNKDSLYFYGRYKCATEGKPLSKNCPSIFDRVGSNKFYAWVNAYKNCLTKSKAMEEYIDRVESITGIKLSENTIVNNTTMSVDMKPSKMLHEEEEELDENADDNEKLLYEWKKILQNNDIISVEKILDGDKKNLLLDLWDKTLGMSALHLAADSGRAMICGLLCLNGIDVNKKDDEGQTPMHIAIECDHEDVALILARHSPNLEIKNNEGKSVYDLLEEKKLRDLTMSIEKIMFSEMKEEDQIKFDHF